MFAHENIATTLHNHIPYTANANQYIVQNALFKSMHVNRLICNTPVKQMAEKT